MTDVNTGKILCCPLEVNITYSKMGEKVIRRGWAREVG
jgi:hypothetical protein